MVDVSVILPVFNTERYIREAIQSIVDQTFRNWELILIDDASTDGTLEIARSFEDSRVKIVQNPSNMKVVKSLNLGIRLSSGRYIARMDADDIAHPLRLAKQFKYLEEHQDIALCGTWVQSIGGENRIIRGPLRHEQIQASFLFHNVIVHPSVMFRKEPFMEQGMLYDDTFTNAEDYGLWVRAIEKFRLSNMGEVLLKYRVHDLNVSVLKAVNQGELDRMHYRIYTYYLNVLQIPFKEEDLVIHRKIGLRRLGRLEGRELSDNLDWLRRLTVANRKIRYFERSAFSYVIISNIVHIGKAIRPGLRNYVRYVAAAFRMFEPGDFLKYAIRLFKLKTKKVEQF